MSSHRDTGGACDLAALYSLGALDREEKWAFHEHVVADCEVCVEELEGIEHVVRQLAFAAEPVSPSPILRDRLMDAVSGEREMSGARSPFDRLDAEWHEHVSRGIRYRIVNVDEAARMVLAVVRADAGATYRSHRHMGVEEMFMLEGDLQFGDRVFKAGDYIRSEKGTEHESSETREGCSFLLRASLDDGLLT